MKTKRILSFVCVLALVLTMCSAFTFAAAPEAEEEAQSGMSTRDLQIGTLNRDTYLYSSPST
ncbi:MAG: hypothetical protein IKU11_05810, partial [Clostridia bacterium]|nr:hypothetical protein [Clostridia bacterium]